MEKAIRVYDALMEKVNGSLDIQYEKSRLRGDNYASVYANAIIEVLRLAMDKELKDAQVALVNSQQAEQDQSIPAKIKLLEAQARSEEAKTKLLQRQTLVPDDNLRIKKAEITGSTLGMVFATGTVVDAPKWNDFNDKINAI